MFTLKQKKFIEFYEGNATEAAIKAGYSKDTARSIGQENLTKPDIQKAIQSRQEKNINPKIADRNERAELYTNLLRTSDDEAIRIKACETLGKMEGDFIERHEHKGNISISYKFTRVKNGN